MVLGYEWQVNIQALVDPLCVLFYVPGKCRRCLHHLGIVRHSGSFISSWESIWLVVFDLVRHLNVKCSILLQFLHWKWLAEQGNPCLWWVSLHFIQVLGSIGFWFVCAFTGFLAAGVGPLWKGCFLFHRTVGCIADLALGLYVALVIFAGIAFFLFSMDLVDSLLLWSLSSCYVFCSCMACFHAF